MDSFQNLELWLPDQKRSPNSAPDLSKHWECHQHIRFWQVHQLESSKSDDQVYEAPVSCVLL